MDRIHMEIADGWVPLVDDLFLEMESELQHTGIDLFIDQIKSKYGGLRCYYHVDFPEGYKEVNRERFITSIDKLVSEAELKSYTICEVCGNPGRLRKGSWLETLCDDHSQLRLPFANGEMWGHGRA